MSARDGPPGQPCELTPAERTYASSVSLAQMLYGGDLAAWLAAERPDVYVEHQTGTPVMLLPPSAPQSRRVTIVRAPMGSGKTTALIDWLRVQPGGAAASVLVVSCRRSFTHTLHQRFRAAGLPGFVTYLDSGDYVMAGAEFRRLIVQIESLHRVDEALLGGYDVLVLDEAMSALAQLYSPTMTHLSRVDALLHRLLRTCPRILAMDATINSQFVDLVAGLRGAGNVRVVLNRHAAPGFSRRRCVFLRELGVEALVRALAPGGAPPDARAPESFFGRLGARLAANQNVCVFSSTVLFSELVARFCARFTPAVLLLNSARPASPVDDWAAARVLIYTTVVTVGISFERRHFHCMFAYVKPMSHGPDMVSVYQSLGRIRDLVHGELHVYLDGGGARLEPVFTPMLLNHVVRNHGGWPSTFTQVTDLLCCRFRLTCRRSFVPPRGLTLFAKFKYKHFFERCTLASVGDSLNILHALLEHNRIAVALLGCERVTAARFCEFIAHLRADAVANAGALRDLKRVLVPSPDPGVEIADSADISAFVHKYLPSDVPPDALARLLRRMGLPGPREHLVNLAVLGACLRLPAALASFDVFRRVYEHYASGNIPFIAESGALDVAPIAPSVVCAARWELYQRCARLALAVGLDVRDPRVRDLSAEEIVAWIGPDQDRYTDWLMELVRCHVAPASVVARAPVARATSALAGRRPPRRRGVSREEHAVHVFKVVWEDVFGVGVARSLQTFPGAGRVKNLRKGDIVALLRLRGIDHSADHTHRELYRTLMANKDLFRERRYKLRPPKWSSYICFLASDASILCEAALDAALEAVPPTAWPLSEGALDFARL
ncbi:DNA replication origin-binding helicase [Beluga whale alphaherpesvirus 1]|uniref:Replication origin-binding protein n=1 Tax=Beluga whale alphaherpesvirus 1 TaxID=1434720 RepID=A0A286MM72_9ALPH|nr:DNA replication origin-binding helicase [Beluga whale alphaherpesvirus 1]ASW27098.1 DNA replication origin-binding helicase [Beluga whale alphaherpesvirus 1]